MKFFSAGATIALLFAPCAAQAQFTNAVYINQIGDGSKVIITQEGERNQIGDTPELPAILGGSNGVATITQTGNDNRVASPVTVKDGSNGLTVTQQGNRNLYDYGRTLGAKNAISLIQLGSGNAAGTSVGGQQNVLSVRQEGRGNNARLIAYGDGNMLTALSKGDGNTIRLRSEGSNNALTVRQIGAGHTAVVNQGGNNATLTITQR